MMYTYAPIKIRYMIIYSLSSSRRRHHHHDVHTYTLIKIRYLIRLYCTYLRTHVPTHQPTHQPSTPITNHSIRTILSMYLRTHLRTHPCTYAPTHSHHPYVYRRIIQALPTSIPEGTPHAPTTTTTSGCSETAPLFFHPFCIFPAFGG